MKCEKCERDASKVYTDPEGKEIYVCAEHFEQLTEKDWLHY